MGRHKTISDNEVLRVAREIFRGQGHDATTRAIAEAAGISEAILYQRFGSKDALFFTAMHATGPDIEHLLGPGEPPDDARAYLRAVVIRLGKYFAEVIPLALRVMTHPSFESKMLPRVQPGGPAALQKAFAERLASLARRKLIVTRAEDMIAKVLVSLAHDWALRRVLAHETSARGTNELEQMVEVVWNGVRGR
jgi:AcrR family transcriptional regulator